MMNHVEKGCHYFNQGFSCAQSVLAPFASEFGLDEQLAIKLASGFGAGMGRMGEVCGALTGAFMVVGLIFGGVNPDRTQNHNATKLTYTHIAQLSEFFTGHYGSIQCKTLLGLDLSFPEDRLIALKKNIYTNQCLEYVQSTIKWLDQTIQSTDTNNS